MAKFQSQLGESSKKLPEIDNRLKLRGKSKRLKDCQHFFINRMCQGTDEEARQQGCSFKTTSPGAQQLVTSSPGSVSSRHQILCKLAKKESAVAEFLQHLHL